MLYVIDFSEWGVLYTGSITFSLLSTIETEAIWGHFGTELKKVQLPETPLKRLIGFRTCPDMRWNRLVLNFATHPGSSPESGST